MGCYSREIGRFYLEHKAYPSYNLRRFMRGACGNFAPRIEVTPFEWDAPDAKSDAQLLAEIADSLRVALRKALSGSMDTAGFWFGRRAGRAVTVVATSTDKADIKPFSLVPNALGEVTIEGRIREETRYISAHINYGSIHVQPCDFDLAVVRPAFRVTCRPYSADDSAWIQIFYAEPGRVLSSPFAEILVRRSVDIPPDYLAVHYAEPRPVDSPGAFTRAAIEQINRARKLAGLRGVTLAERQSATATKLAPSLFHAVSGEGDPEDEETIVQGLLAGWEVGGMIREGTLAVEIAATTDAGQWLNSALEMPMGRKTVFDPDVEQMALGPLVFSDPDALGAVVTGYRFHHTNDHSDDVKMLMSRVVWSRRRMGLPEPKRLRDFESVMTGELAKVHDGNMELLDALNQVVTIARERFGNGMQGYLLEAASLDELQIPQEVLRTPTLGLDIGVTHYKVPGAAWAQYAILVVYGNFKNM
jgi:hypothetical protein